MSWFVGIDWADREHAVAVIDGAGDQHGAWKVAHSGKGITALLERLDGLGATGRAVAVALETPHGLLVESLLEAGFTVYAINPKAVDRYRERWSPSGSKSDPGDALVLAHVLRTDRARHRPIHPSGDLARELFALTRHRRQLMTLRTQLVNQLRSTLKAYYPQAADVFSKLDQPVTLAFLESFPEPATLASLSPKRWRAFLRRHRYPDLQRAPLLLARLQTPHIAVPASAACGHRPFMLALVGQLQALLPAIEVLERQIGARFAEHPDHSIFASLPGAGPVIAPELLAELGDARARFPQPGVLRAEAGSAPVTKASGRRRSVYFRRACNHQLRQTLQQLARQSIRQSAWAKAAYTAARARGHSHSRAARGLADQWVRILWRMWVDRTTYDDALHARNRRLHAPRIAA